MWLSAAVRAATNLAFTRAATTGSLLGRAGFFKAGQVKIANWDSTLFLFEYEYQVPLLPFEVAAYMATATELLLPPLLALGLLTRPVALLLFVFNVVAVVSYPVLWEQGFVDHQLWGLMLLVSVVFGPGKLSLDHWLQQHSQGKAGG